MKIEFDSFAGLAKHFGMAKAEIKKKEAAFLQVEARCGRRAAIVWAVLQDREATKSYGKRGRIVSRSSDIAEAVGYTTKETEKFLTDLILAGHARYTENEAGPIVKAA